MTKKLSRIWRSTESASGGATEVFYDPNALEDYDLGHSNLVLLESDVGKAFRDDESVNEVLRMIAKAARRLTPARNSRGKRGQQSERKLVVKAAE